MFVFLFLWPFKEVCFWKIKKVATKASRTKIRTSQRSIRHVSSWGSQSLIMVTVGRKNSSLTGSDLQLKQAHVTSLRTESIVWMLVSTKTKTFSPGTVKWKLLILFKIFDYIFDISTFSDIFTNSKFWLRNSKNKKSVKKKLPSVETCLLHWLFSGGIPFYKMLIKIINCKYLFIRC